MAEQNQKLKKWSSCRHRLMTRAGRAPTTWRHPHQTGIRHRRPHSSRGSTCSRGPRPRSSPRSKRNCPWGGARCATKGATASTTGVRQPLPAPYQPPRAPLLDARARPTASAAPAAQPLTPACLVRDAMVSQMSKQIRRPGCTLSNPPRRASIVRASTRGARRHGSIWVRSTTRR